MGYYDDRDLPFYWNVADEYVLFDRFFTSAAGGSVRNHMFWVTGTPGHRRPTSREGFGELPTIFDRLEERGISWKFYVAELRPADHCRTGTASAASRSSGCRCSTTLASSTTRSSSATSSTSRSTTRTSSAAPCPRSPTSFPSGSSEHPPGRVQAGERSSGALLTALMRSAPGTARPSCGPTTTGAAGTTTCGRRRSTVGYGFRVPALLVSPYARRGHVDSTHARLHLDPEVHRGQLGAEPLAARDARARSIAGAFDFSRPPREPSLILAARAPSRRERRAARAR